MSQQATNITLRMPPALHEKVRRASSKQGLSLNTYIVRALAQEAESQEAKVTEKP